jgi:hypothetical protein
MLFIYDLSQFIAFTSAVLQHCSQERKVIHTSKKLFCNVVSICNLVQEFNGLVSIKGPAKVGPFTFTPGFIFYIFLHTIF